MKELEFSFMSRDPRVNEMVQSLLDDFESQTGVRVTLRLMTWESGRAELTRTALYHAGPDVSEIGTTWVGDLMAMNALRPFSSAEARTLGPAEDFLPAAWNTCRLVGSQDTLAIPWQAETFALHYRKDFLRQAGVDETEAFKSLDGLLDTAQRLAKAGITVPFEFPFGTLTGNFLILHFIAAWLWAAGTDIVTPDGKKTLFGEGAGLEAVKQFMSLLTTISPDGYKLLINRTPGTTFLEGKAGLFLVQPNYIQMMSSMVSPEMLENWAITDLPEAHFMGGSNLVIWKHNRDDQACLELVNFLTRPENLQSFPVQFSGTPPRYSVLNSNAYKGNAFKRLIAQSMMTGRTFPSFSLLGLVEGRLVSALTQIAVAYANNTEQDLDTLIEKILVPMAQKLDVTLSK